MAAQGPAGRFDKARNLVQTGDELPNAGEDEEMIEVPDKRRRKKNRKKERRRRERKDKRKKDKGPLYDEDDEGLEGRFDRSPREYEQETEVAWSPTAPLRPAVQEKQEPGLEVYYEMMDEELEGLRDTIGWHERQLVDFAAPLISRIPQPPQPYITNLCCCTKCCGRCCDVYGHKKDEHLRPFTVDVGTDSMESDLLEEEARKKFRRRRGFVADMDPDTTGFGDETSLTKLGKGSKFKYETQDKDTDSDSSDDVTKKNQLKGSKRHVSAARLVRKKSEDLRRVPIKLSVGSKTAADAAPGELIRKAKLSRKSSVKHSRLTTNLLGKSHGRQTPRASAQFNLHDGATLLDSASTSRDSSPLERSLFLDDFDARSVLPEGSSGGRENRGISFVRWQPPESDYDPFSFQTPNASRNIEDWPVGRSEFLYYTEQPACPEGNALLRSVQSLPTNVYSMRIAPDVPASYARQGQLNEWPPFRPEPPPPSQERRVSPLAAAAYDLSGKATAITRQAKEALDAAKVLKRASDDALQVAMRNQHFDGRSSEEVSLSFSERDSTESFRPVSRPAMPPSLRAELSPPQPMSLQQQDQQLPESRPVAKSILKTPTSPARSVSLRNVSSERSFERTSSEEDRSFMKQSPSLATGPKIKIKPPEAESGGEASKPEGRPRARFADTAAEPAPKKTGVRRRGSVFVRGSLFTDDDDEEEKKPSPTKTPQDDVAAKKATPSGQDGPQPSGGDTLERLKHSISSLASFQIKKPETDAETEKKLDVISAPGTGQDAANVSVKRVGTFGATDSQNALAITDRTREPQTPMETGKEPSTAAHEGKGKVESALVMGAWRKQDVVTVCDKSTCITLDRATATPSQWMQPQLCPQVPPIPCRCLSALSCLSPCSLCAGEEDSLWSDTFMTPRSMTSATSASQTIGIGGKYSRKSSEAMLVTDAESKGGASAKKRRTSKQGEKFKGKKSTERRRSSLKMKQGADATQNVADLDKGNDIVTAMLSDTLLDVGPGQGAPAKKQPAATKQRKGSDAKTELESEFISPVTDRNRRPSDDKKPRKGSATSEDQQDYVVLPVEPLQESGETTPVAPDAMPALTKNEMPGEGDDVGTVMTPPGYQETVEGGYLEDEDRRGSAADNELVDGYAKRDSLDGSPPDGDSTKKAFSKEASHVDADFEATGLDEGGPDADFEKPVDDIDVDRIDDFGLEAADAEKHADEEDAKFKPLGREEKAYGQAAEEPMLQLPEAEAQLAAVVSIPFEGDRKFWVYKDSTMSLYPESKVGVTTAFLCAGWIILLLYLSEIHHGWFAISSTASTSKPLPKSPSSSATWPTYPSPGPTEITMAPTYPPMTKTTQDISIGTSDVPKMDAYFCATPHCEKEARYLSSFLLGDPCENFYENICVNLSRTWPQPSPGSVVSTSSMMAQQIQTIAEEYIADNYNSDVKIARELLSACLTLEEPDKRRAAVASTVNELLGVTWPIDRAYEAHLPDPWDVAGQLARELNLEPLASLSVDVHPEKAGATIIGIDEPSLLHRRSAAGTQLSDLITSSVQEAVFLVRPGPDASDISRAIVDTMFTICDLSAPPSVKYFGSENYRVTPIGELGSGIRSMLDTVFLSHSALEDGTEILVKSPSYFLRLRASTVLKPRELLNYMGYRVFLHFGAFVSSSALEEVHSIFTHGRVNTREGTRLGLCSREVEHVLPAMYTRAFFKRIRKTSFDMARVWASKVEHNFQRSLSRLLWFRERTHGVSDSVDLRLANHKLSTSRIQYFYPAWIMNDAKYRLYAHEMQQRLERGSRSEGIVKYVRILHAARFAEKMGLLSGGPRGASFGASIFDASPQYDVQRKSLFVPAAVVNVSVPTSGSLFALHIARFGVRLIRGLVPALYNDFVFSYQPSDDAPLLYTHDYDRRLRDTVKCLVGDYLRAPDILKSSFMRRMSDVSPAGFSFLEQTVALMQSFWAFEELLDVKRVWRSDFRFALLPDLTAEQLFFVYYALDNCEASDDDYRARAFETRFELPPEDRVNFPLLQMDAFKRAFSCRGRSPMATAPQCSVAF
ncbi:hypothetical protein V5799_033669 [Amblyomma americanum]|uniref:Uncharacterized protein n=1 Tax=Amblyomma americanum TaxID=6943 RepID=A0AAQ4DMM6_AMBAM